MILTRINSAYDLAKVGKRHEALDICFSLRLRPDLSLYVRATLNVFIGAIALIDNKKYFVKAPSLIAVIRDENRDENARYKSYPELDSLEEEAKIWLEQLGGSPGQGVRDGSIERMYREDSRNATVSSSGQQSDEQSQVTGEPSQRSADLGE